MDVAATRELELSRPDGTTTSVVVEIGRPSSIGEGLGHRCEYRILGLERTITGSAEGADGAEALFLALVHIGVQLRHSDEMQQGRLRWREGRADLGFPPFRCIGHLW